MSPARAWLIAAMLAATSAAAEPALPLDRAMGILDVAPESELDTIVARLGGTEQSNGGDAGAAMSFVCYRGADGTVLLFLEGVLGGGYQLLAREGLADLSGDERFHSPVKSPQCAPAAISAATRNFAGLHLGMSEEEVTRRLGPPSSRHRARWRYQVSREFTQKGEPAERTQTLDCVFEHGRLVAMRAYQVTTD